MLKFTGNCGTRPNVRIVGGHEAAVNGWPWQVQLRSYSPFCGGSLVDPLWVVTATHCVTNASPSDFKIRYFINNFTLHPFAKEELLSCESLIFDD